jgi:phosphatidylserine decarboxylase
MNIQYYNRYTKKVESEKVYGEGFLRFAYEGAGKIFQSFLGQAWFSQAYGFIQDLPLSKVKVQKFIRDFSIPMEDFLPEEGRSKEDPYSNFNQFFIRRFRPGLRPFPSAPEVFGAPCEARYIGFEEHQDEQHFPVKGVYLRAKDLLGKDIEDFRGGPVVIARLCPVDYHRFHFSDNAEIISEYRIHGDLQSVSPIALKERPEIFIKNERSVTLMQTENFGPLAFIEVGATCVGKIVQSYKGPHVERGAEKGYFLFGGSTVIILGQKGRFRLSDDLRENSLKGLETYLHLGDSMGQALQK